ncbi:outer membrane beta-barrel protein [Dyadobacter sandarakinus]|uniref:Outer membrane beta-barrel protein n=1 Tax=Dyadobacter sandarakinus TaxID=2747268 RepID=A0ABX7I4X7_9BACT|nr:outer membrane beta-barrel protein [Dyadobacter sandarakinus]QRR01151.1 outer membrane beta-barrel protein [Dyadobacter sandarakinus]
MHKVLPYLTICLLLIFNNAVAQRDTLVWKPGLKLQSSDFVIDPSSVNIFNDISLVYGYRLQPGKPGKFLLIVNTAAVLNRKTSSLPDSSDTALRYVQIQFDLSGYHSRLIKLKASELGEISGRLVAAKMDSITFQANQEVSVLKKAFAEEFFRHPNKETLQKWEMKISDLLTSTPEIDEERIPGKLTYGLFAGVGHNIFKSKTSENFTNATGINFGLNYDIKKSRFVIDLNLNFNKTKQELEKNGYWPSGMKTHFASIELTYGYKINKNKWLLAPYGGFSINEFTPAKTNKEDKRRMAGYSPVLGLEINRYFKTMADLHEKARIYYKLRMSVNPTNLIKDYAGTQLNIKLAIGFDAVRIKTRLVKKV